MPFLYEEHPMNNEWLWEHPEKNLEVIRIWRSGKEPTQEEIDKAKLEYFARGGTIKKDPEGIIYVGEFNRPKR